MKASVERRAQFLDSRKPAISNRSDFLFDAPRADRTSWQALQNIDEGSCPEAALQD